MIPIRKGLVIPLGKVNCLCDRSAVCGKQIPDLVLDCLEEGGCLQGGYWKKEGVAVEVG